MKIKSAGIIILNKENKILLFHPTKQMGTILSIPKGKVEDGESFLDCAIREAKEEGNLNISSMMESGNFNLIEIDSVSYNKKKTLKPFILQEKIESNYVWDSYEFISNSEMDSFLWIDISKIDDIDIHEIQRNVIKNSLNNIKIINN